MFTGNGNTSKLSELVSISAAIRGKKVRERESRLFICLFKSESHLTQ